MDYVLMMHPAKVFMHCFVALCLLVTGIGCYILSRGFIFAIVLLNYLWQTYIFLYEKTMVHILLNCEAQISSLLNLLSVKSPLLALLDERTLAYFLQMVLFFCLSYYLDWFERYRILSLNYVSGGIIEEEKGK